MPLGSAWPAETPDASAPLTAARQAHVLGRALVDQFVVWAFIVGIGAAFFFYYRGYRASTAMLKIRPVRWIHMWLYRRMYFDELYFIVFESIALGLGAFCAFFDRYIVDGVVNGIATVSLGLSMAATATDRYFFDGAVNGVASLSQDVGAVVRSPQTGRIRTYVMVLMAAITLGLAGAVILVMSR